MNAKTGVLITNLGTPTAPTKQAVRKFLAEFLSDSRVVSIPKPIWLPILYGIILTIRPAKTAKLYQNIWLDNGSPLMVYSNNLTRQLTQQFDDHVSIKLGMRYGPPSIKQALTQFQQQGIERLIILSLYPQYSVTTTASIYDEVMQFYRDKINIPNIYFIKDYHQHNGYIEALANKITTYWQQHGRSEKLLLSFHGIPQRLVNNGDPYFNQCQTTAKLLAEKLKLADDQWLLTFQSRFGKEKWLQPYTDKTLEKLAQQGVTTLDVICPGFATDCLETLEEIAITNQELFIEHGGKKINYIPALNDDAEHAAMLAQLLWTKCAAGKQQDHHEL